MKVSIYTIVVNLLLSVFKFAAGVLAHSGAMVSDSVHSASDVFSTLVVMAGVAISSKAADEQHQYGHERFECVAAVLLSIVLFATGAAIGYKALVRIIAGDYGKIAIPGTLAVIAAIVSIVVKEGMYWYTRSAALKIKSTALMADAWHHRSDALSSVGSMIGIIGAKMGIVIMDTIASMVICIFIMKAAISIFVDAIRKLIDESCDKMLATEMKELIMKQEGVGAIDIFKTRQFGDRIYIDVEISVDGEMTLRESHEIAERVHDAVEQEFCSVKHCMVHVNPKK